MISLEAVICIKDIKDKMRPSRMIATATAMEKMAIYFAMDTIYCSLKMEPRLIDLLFLED